MSMRNPILDHYEREYGIYFSDAVELAKDEWKHDYHIAMDAQPTLITTPNSGIPAFLTTIVDPNLLRVLTAKNNATKILEEVRKGDWTMGYAMFPVVESTGDVSSYGDFNNNGRANANTNFPQRQSYLYQTVPEYGELELEREGLAKINWAAEVREAGVIVLNKFQNLMYFKGIAGLENYGLQTDPSLPAPIAPSLKSTGVFSWLNGTAPAATPNEIFADIQALVNELINQSNGNIDIESQMVLGLSPSRLGAITASNSFGVNVPALIKENYPKLRLQGAIQYGALTSSNPQGVAVGEQAQLIATKVEGQDSGWCAFSEKLRAHPVIRDLSSFRQKLTQGGWGTIVRQPFAYAQMIGI